MKKRTKEEENEYRKALRAKKKVGQSEHPTDVPPTDKNIPPVVKDVPPRDENVPPSIPPKPQAIGDMIDETAKMIEEAYPGHDKKAIAMAALARIAANETPEDRERRHSLPWEKCCEVCYGGKPLAQAMKESGL